MLRTKVKASAINNLTDARYFAALEVTWLGFRLDPGHEHYVQPQIVKAIREWVDGVEIVGEFELQTANDIRTAADLLELDAIQVGMFTPVETLIELQSSRPVIKEIVVEADTTSAVLEDTLEQFAPYCALFLLDFAKSGLNWADLQAGAYALTHQDLQSICAQYPILLAMDLSPDGLRKVLDTLPVAGLCFTGGEEEKVGYKSFDELDELLEAISVEE